MNGQESISSTFKLTIKLRKNEQEEFISYQLGDLAEGAQVRIEFEGSASQKFLTGISGVRMKL